MVKHFFTNVPVTIKVKVTEKFRAKMLDKWKNN